MIQNYKSNGVLYFKYFRSSIQKKQTLIKKKDNHHSYPFQFYYFINLNPLRKVQNSDFKLFSTPIPEGKKLKIRILQKSPLGDLGVL